MTELFYAISCIGLMCILKYGSILSTPRDFVCSKSKYLKELFSCSLCLGFWSGALVGVFIYFLDSSFWSPKFYLLPLFSAVTCWVSDSLIGIFSYTEKFIAHKVLK